MVRAPYTLVVTHYSSNREEQMEEVEMKKEQDMGDGQERQTLFKKANYLQAESHDGVLEHLVGKEQEKKQ